MRLVLRQNSYFILEIEFPMDWWPSPTPTMDLWCQLKSTESTVAGQVWYYALVVSLILCPIVYLDYSLFIHDPYNRSIHHGHTIGTYEWSIHIHLHVNIYIYVSSLIIIGVQYTYTSINVYIYIYDPRNMYTYTILL